MKYLEAIQRKINVSNDESSTNSNMEDKDDENSKAIAFC
jgi:hypothetical protein